jgi:hypothetical protein
MGEDGSWARRGHGRGRVDRIQTWSVLNSRCRRGRCENNPFRAHHTSRVPHKIWRDGNALLFPGPQLYLGGLEHQTTAFGRNGISMARRAINHLNLIPRYESRGLPLTRISRGFKSMSCSGLG